MAKQQKPKVPGVRTKAGKRKAAVVSRRTRRRTVKTPGKAAKPQAEPAKEILLAGSGGQGVILAGKMLAQAAVAQGWNATYIPAYGAEVRGGTAYSHVKIAHRQIGSPIVEDATVLVVMNEPSYKAFSSLLRKGSTLVVNSSLVPTVKKHRGVKTVSLELTRIAADMGSLRSANMLVFGLCAGLLGLEDGEPLKNLVSDTFGKKSPAILEINQQILEKGIELGRHAAASAYADSA